MSFRQLLSMCLAVFLILCLFLSLSYPSDSHRLYAQAFTTSKADGSFYIFVSDSEMKNARDHGASNVLLATFNSESAIINIDDSRLETKSIVLLPTTPVKFHVVDEDGKPVAGIEIAVDSLQTSQNGDFNTCLNEVGEPWKVLTDKLGNAAISDIPYNSRVKFDIKSAAYMLLDDIGIQNLTKTPDVQTIRLAIPGSISGKIASPDTNKPVANVHVHISSAESTVRRDYDVNTDANGVYSAAQILPGTYTISPVLGGDISEQWTASPKGGVKVDHGKSVSDVDLMLISGAILTGKVTDNTTGARVSDVRIYISHVNGNNATIVSGVSSTFSFSGSTQYAVVHKDGTYIIHVAPGSMRVMPISTSGGSISFDLTNVLSINLADGEAKTLDFRVDANSAP